MCTFVYNIFVSWPTSQSGCEPFIKAIVIVIIAALGSIHRFSAKLGFSGSWPAQLLQTRCLSTYLYDRLDLNVVVLEEAHQATDALMVSARLAQSAALPGPVWYDPESTLENALKSQLTPRQQHHYNVCINRTWRKLVLQRGLVALPFFNTVVAHINGNTFNKHEDTIALCMCVFMSLACVLIYVRCNIIQR